MIQAQNSPSGADPLAAYWSCETAILFSLLKTSANGLSGKEAARRLEQYGANTLDQLHPASAILVLAAQFRSPLVLILIGAAMIAVTVGEFQEAVIIWLVVLASCILSFAQEYRASRSMERLRQSIAHRSTVIRDGQRLEIPASQIVPGDVICLSAGKLAPADAVVLEGTDFDVSQSILTGEAFPAAKTTDPSPADASVSERRNVVFAGTSVRTGAALVLAVRTGARTEFAHIASAVERRPPETDFARGIRRFGTMMTQIMLVMVIAVLALNMLLERPFVDSLLFSIALGVGLTPELLPAIVSVTLARGARTMETNGVLVRRLASIENLGSMDVLCTDKTGTLTEGVIRLDGAVDPGGSESEDVRLWATLNATMQSGLDNPLDDAIRNSDRFPALAASQYSKIDEIPYDFSRKRLSIVCRRSGGSPLLICKGALENVLEICTSVAAGSGKKPLSDESREQFDILFKHWSQNGYRVLGLAIRSLDVREDYARDDEVDLTFVGFLLFQDTPKQGVEEAISKLSHAGVRIRVITGDNRYAAAHLAQQIGLPARHIVTGSQMMRMSRDALSAIAPRTDIFAEIDPNQKELIVGALKQRGHVVGFLGDGINDAPALRDADVGITVDSAVDVAREAADIVLLRKDLAVLLAGIRDGRRTFENTMKYISITMSANFGNMISMALASVLLPFLPLLAKQILLNNFLSDIPALAIAGDSVDGEQMRRPRHWDIGYVRRFMIAFGLVSSAFDFVTFGFLYYWLHASEPLFQTGWFVLSLVSELGIVFVLRTRRKCWTSRPDGLLAIVSGMVMIVAVAFPWLPIAASFGFVPLPGVVIIGVAAIALAYLAVSESLKHLLFSHNIIRGRRRTPITRPAKTP
ncbi:MAG: magnesium-translocating P-type ATPase [Flavobacteriaceae bacterium]